MAQNVDRSEGVSPPERLISFLRVRARGWCGAAPGVGWATRVCRAARRSRAARAGVRVFRGSFRVTGTTRMRSPDRDLQNVP